MKSRYLIAAAALTLSAAAYAADGEATFKKSSCGACHQLEKKSVGPKTVSDADIKTIVAWILTQK